MKAYRRRKPSDLVVVQTVLYYVAIVFAVVALIGSLVLLPFVAKAATDPQNIVFDCDTEAARGNAVTALACNIYHEARGEPEPGMWLVAFSTRNRKDGKLYPNTYAEVVYELRRDKRTKKMVPMHSWTFDGKHDRVYNEERWMLALLIASRIVASDEGLIPYIPDITYGCQWYHRTDITPYWKKQYHPTVVIGNHQCYALNEKAMLKSMARQLPTFDDVMKGRAFYGAK